LHEESRPYEISHYQLGVSAYRRISVPAASWLKIIRQAGDAMNKSADDPSPQLKELPTRLSETIESARAAIAKADSAALHAMRNVASSAEDYVRENPWVAIGVIAGVAASVGFLAGYMAAPQRSMMGMLRRR
jgi:ElaB/YqjD/DUF883 family membrane-anchored ribosome-binding protein